MKKNKPLKIFLILLSSMFTIYLLICLSLYLFEPIAYSAPDLSIADYSFDMYNKFSSDKDSDFYIKQLSYSDIAVAEDDIRLKYVDDTLLVILNKDIPFDEAEEFFKKYDAEICGYIDILDFYQITTETAIYEELVDKCSEIENDQLVKSAIIDYFEETPTAETVSDEFVISNDYNPVYYEMIGLNKLDTLIDLEKIAPSVKVGVFDIFVNYENPQLNVINKDEYSVKTLDSSLIANGASHGTHVAGIIGAKNDSTINVKGVIPGVAIYSDNATNNSVSYWIASIANMITKQNIKAINLSMGYNSYIPVSASLGDEGAIAYIKDENDFFEGILSKIIDGGFDFLFCVAAGNEANRTLYKVDSPYFAYGNKKILSELDIFGIFDSKPEYCDSKYGLCFNYIENPEVRDRIIVVTACDSNKNIARYASSGERIDIAAPGDEICSTGYPDKYEHMSGTSMATPFVTGTAALLFELDSTLSGKQIKDIIINSSSEKLSDKCFSYPLLNVYNAVEYVVK